MSMAADGLVSMRRSGIVWTLVVVSLACLPNTADAYVGPGAGFAIGGSFLAVLAAIGSAILMLLAWPVRMFIRRVFHRRPPKPPQAKRVVVLGLDGLDYGLTEKLLAAGQLPNLSALREQGCLKPLASTLPPISPVAWSTFQTGVNPGKHNIFDFITPDLQTYRPKISSVEIRSPQRAFRLGPIELPWGKPIVRLLRKSRPFWSILSEYGIFNCILRVPITFPPEKLRGVQLSAMCVPDLRGTQGTFAHYSTTPRAAEDDSDHDFHLVRRDGRKIVAELTGPEHPYRSAAGTLKCPLVFTLHESGRTTVKVNGSTFDLQPGVYTDWIQVRFRLGWGSSITGVCRFLLQSREPVFELYVTPINIDPENPVLPLGYPAIYPIYLAKKQGPYATLGLAEDTTGLSEEVLNDEQFLQQCLQTDAEREAMFFDGLSKVPQGLVVCVFDGTDRMQHMFWRYLDPAHPARPQSVPAAHEHAIEDLYRRMDALVGRTRERCRDPGTVLMVVSDHGFNTFRRGIDLNRWLEQEGYLHVDHARRNERYLGGVDWSQTRAFAIGLTGIFLNVRGRFSQGIVEPGEEAERVRNEIAQKLSGLVDPKTGTKVIRRVYQAVRAYRGPYKEAAPDLIVGYEQGYRVSWSAAVGKTSAELFQDNLKAWSGDHCVDPSVVPGVLFCNRPIAADNPRLLDLAPTVLELFGIPAPDYMDGTALPVGDAAATARTPALAEVA
jgi:predicted AlkP superfamily phosphohydrolase/phosphomutase